MKNQVKTKTKSDTQVIVLAALAVIAGVSLVVSTLVGTGSGGGNYYGGSTNSRNGNSNSVVVCSDSARPTKCAKTINNVLHIACCATNELCNNGGAADSEPFCSAGTGD